MRLSPDQLRTASPEDFKETFSLDLSGLELEELPEWLKELAHLTSLDVSNNRLAEVPKWLGDLRQLTSLDLSRNSLRLLPEWLSGAGRGDVSDVRSVVLPRSLGGLADLRTLNLSRTGLRALPRWIGELQRLSTLDLSHNFLSKLPQWLGDQESLERLSLGHNRGIILPEWLGRLDRLIYLDLSGTSLRSLPGFVRQLSGLSTLDLSDNELHTLPDWIGDLALLSSLKIDGNRFTGEIAAVRGREGDDAVLTLLHSRSGGERLREVKVLVLGEALVGKSSLVDRLRHLEFIPDRSTTHGIRLATLKHSRGPFLRFWDFGGQPFYRATHQYFFTEHALYIFVWNGRAGQHLGDLSGHVNRVRLRLNGVPNAVLVATYVPEGTRADLDEGAIQELLGESPKVFEVDNETGDSIDALREHLGSMALKLEHLNDLWSQQSLLLMKRLEELAVERPYLGWSEFLDVAGECGLSMAETEVAVVRMLRIGRVMFFSDRSRIVLQPEFLTKAVAYVLENRGVLSRGGLVSNDELREIWTNPQMPSDGERYRYAREDVAFLRDVMTEFDVAFHIPNTDQYLVAEMVRPGLPASAIVPPEVRSKRLRRRVFNLKCLTLPPGLMARLICRNHRYVVDAQDGAPRQRGVVLHNEYDGSWARIELHGHQIAISVWGDRPDGFLAALIHGVYATLETWDDIDVEEHIYCPTRAGGGGLCERSWSIAELNGQLDMGITQLGCTECSVRHEVASLLSEVVDHPGAVTERLDELRRLTRNVHRQLNTEVPDSPRLISLARVDGSNFNPGNWWNSAVDVLLWCENPDGPHPVGDPYRIQQPRDWYVKAAPALRWTRRLLTLAPIIRGAASLIEEAPDDGSLLDIIDEYSTFVEAVGSLAAEPEKRIDERLFADAIHSNRPELRGVKQLLLDIDPSRQWRGLRRTDFDATVRPEAAHVAASHDGRHYYLCQYHHDEFNPADTSRAGKVG